MLDNIPVISHDYLITDNEILFFTNFYPQYITGFILSFPLINVLKSVAGMFN